MNSDPQSQAAGTQTTPADQTTSIELSAGKPGSLSTVSGGNSDWKEVVDKGANFLDRLPKFIGDIFSEYRRPLTIVGVIILAFVSAAIADGVLDVVNALPLVAPLLELVGLGYTGWFIWRYLLFAEKRQELGQDYKKLKDRVTGKTVD